MRQWDDRNSYLDNDGKPLIGRIRFCKLRTTELENIYNAWGYEISNPVFTNTIGQTEFQIFLKDNANYTIYFDKYIGNGDMSEDTDVSNWHNEYSCDNLWKTFNVVIDSDSYQLINNIADLRNANIEQVKIYDGKKIVSLGGYYENGDKPLVRYVWDENSIEDDNGGSVIKITNISTGRWKLIQDTPYVDVRDFGVFGTESRTDATDDMSLRIGIANDYAISELLPLYFPNTEALTWYKLNNLEITYSMWDRGTKVFGNDDTNTTIYVRNSEQYLDCWNGDDYNAKFTIVSDNVKTSWGSNAVGTTYSPTYKLTIDSPLNTRNKTFMGLIVDCLYGVIEDATFNTCLINSVGMLGDTNTFRNCKITEQMFASNADFGTMDIDSSVEIDLDDFPTTSKWIKLRMQYPFDELDFKGRTLDASCEIGVVTDCIYKDANFNNYPLNQRNSTFVECGGIITDGGTIHNNITLKDSNITFVLNSSTLDNLSLQNSSISFGKNMTIANIVCVNSTINDASYTYYLTDNAFNNSILNVGISTTNFIAKDTTIGKPVSCYNADLRGCHLNADVETNVNFNFIECIFNARHILSVNTQNAVVVGKWIRNNGLVSDPITINDPNSYLVDENQQKYVYEGNYGTFKPSKATFVKDIPNANIENFQYSASIDYPQYGNVGFYIRNGVIRVVCPNIASNDIDIFHVANNGNYLFKIKLFSSVTYNGIVWTPNCEYFKESNRLNEDSINGYQLIPYFYPYIAEAGTTTVNYCKFLVDVEKI